MSKITTIAYFDSDIKPQIIELLRTAKQEVFIASAWFNDEELYGALVDLPRTVKVKVLIKKDDERNTLDWMKLGDCGIKVYQLLQDNEGRSLMHNKFCMIDNHTVITGSYNWTNGANYSNFENVVVIEGDVELCEQYKKQFENLIEPIIDILQNQIKDLISQKDIYIEKVEKLMEWITSYVENYNKFPSNELIKLEAERNGSINPMVIPESLSQSNIIQFEEKINTEKLAEPFHVQEMTRPEIFKWWKEELSRDLKSFFIINYFNQENLNFQPDFEGLKNLLSIERLDISRKNIKSISGISKMKNLRKISCVENPNLTNFKEIENLNLFSIHCDTQIKKFPVELQRFRNLGLSLDKNTSYYYWKKEISNLEETNN
jgi:hypothetical protein